MVFSIIFNADRPKSVQLLNDIFNNFDGDANYFVNVLVSRGVMICMGSYNIRGHVNQDLL